MHLQTPDATVIIPVHNQIGYLKSCIRSLKNAETKATFEILVIDDCSNKESVSELDRLSGFRLLRNFKNLGFLHSCNRASLRAKGTYIVFLNSDTEVTDHWLDELIDTHTRFPEAGLVGSKLVYPDGTLQECGGIVWRDGSAWNYGREQNPDLPEYNYTKETDYVSGAAILIRKDLFLKCGLFDHRYAPAYYEDTDLAFKVRSMGKKVYVEPKSVVIHHEGKSNGTNLNQGIKKYQVRNLKKFCAKWKDTLESEHLPNAENVLQARDRSMHKKRILVIDHYVPTFDRDAGSRCMYMYLQLLVEMGLSVTFFTDNFYRDPEYTPYLERLGIEVLYGVHYRDNHRVWLEENVHQYEYVFLSRPHISIKYIDLIKERSSAKTLYFGHDIHHLRLELEAIYKDVEELKILKTRKQEIELWEKADYLLYPSKEEVDYIASKGFAEKAVEVPIYFYDPNSKPERLPFEESDGILFVGNFNHPPNLDGINWFFDEIYPKIRTKLPNVSITIAGSSIPSSIKSLSSKHISIRSNISDIELKIEYLSSKISIVPLRFGAGVKGKVLESLFYQTPIVTTSFGAQGIPCINECASITNSSTEFADKCYQLLNSELIWKERSEASFYILLKKYSTISCLDILKRLVC
ncbi:glycosyl transferase, group 2 family protein [Verrucomicrobiia bacterium DG1235]|nr:glycosyl transferase, group 2 family protein [Verrucomicrobiae bacterium DG1235]